MLGLCWRILDSGGRLPHIEIQAAEKRDTSPGKMQGLTTGDSLLAAIKTLEAMINCQLMKVRLNADMQLQLQLTGILRDLFIVMDSGIASFANWKLNIIILFPSRIYLVF